LRLAMKKFIAPVVLFILSFSLFGENVSINISGYLTGDNVRVRETPDTNGTQLGFVKSGTNVTCTERTAEKMKIGSMNDYWYRCSIGGMYDGWIYAHFISEGTFNRAAQLKKLKTTASGNTLSEFKTQIMRSKSETNFSCGCEDMDGRGCGEAVVLTTSYIQFDEWDMARVYKIKTITKRNGRFILETEFLYSDYLEETSTSSKTISVELIEKGKVEFDGIPYCN
jgi:hypothetical protein